MPDLKVVVIDTREKPQAIRLIKKHFDDTGQEYIQRGLLVGDYMYYHNPSYVIDRKQSVNELCQNVQSSDHKRFKRELVKAQRLGAKVCILCEDDEVESLEGVKSWANPRRKKNLRSPTGESLYKALDTIMWRYDVDIEFCHKQDTGRRIIELLEAHDER